MRWSVAVLLLGVSCATQQPAPRPAKPEPAPIAAPTVTASQTASASSAPAWTGGAALPEPLPSASAAPVSSRMCAKSGGLAVTSAQPAPRMSLPVAPGKIRCGDAACDAKTQVCCQNHTSQPGCAARQVLSKEARAGQHGRYDKLLPAYLDQMSACAKALGTVGSFDNVSVSYCDDSDDCPAKQVCSLTQDTLNAASLTILECKPGALVTRASAFEECTGDGPCRLPDTVCDGSHCVLRAVGRECGDESCPTGTACCWRRSGCFACTKAGDCQGAGNGVAQDCFSSRDCPMPRRCHVVLDSDSLGAYYYGGSSCQVGDHELCQTDADCRPEQNGHRLKGCSDPHGMPVPWPDEAPHGLKLCDYSE